MSEVKQERIPFGNLQSSGLDELGGASPVAMNVVAESTGTVRRRPGLKLYQAGAVDAGGIAGLHVTAGGDVYAVGATTAPYRSIYRIAGGASTSLSAVPSADLRGSSRPVFTETESILAIAGGEEQQKVELATFQSTRLANVPVKGSHIVANASRLLVNDSFSFRAQVYFSNQAAGSSFAGFEDWTTALATGFFSAEGRPDPIVALGENTNEVWVFGTETVQLFAPDAQSVYSPTLTKEIGCSAPYSVVKSDQSFAWLDHLRRFQLSDARTTAVISEPIQRTLDEMTRVDDCFGYRIIAGPLDTIIWTFPTDGRTFAFQKGAGWAEWSGYSAAASSWLQFPVTAKTTLRDTRQDLIGTSTGLLATVEFGTTTDLDSPINAYVITGFQDRGTDARKRCRSVRVALRRGGTVGSTEPAALLSWRDGLGGWEGPLEVSLGASGEIDPVVRFHSLGVYRRRQWKLEFVGAEDLVLASATEEFEMLGGD